MKGIALCGFMGCGKTTVALALSEKYNLNHIDTDKYIEEKSGMTISKMFELYGEAYFRDKEFEAICTLCENSDNVLALGGGAVLFPRNVEVLKNSGYKLIFIDTDFDVIKNRLESDNSRPLLKTNDIKTLYDTRYPIYENACDIKLSCKDETGEQLADIIIETIAKEG
ncbi:MAG: shikimate kinase [Ruminococcus sp.]|nr:shikimate kinase [Ruminococcus sp.]